MAFTGADIVAAAEKYKGVPYGVGSADPGHHPATLDCSSIVQQALLDLGQTVSRTTYTQLADAQHGGPGQFLPPGTPLQVGDVVHTDGNSHEEIYIGGGKFFAEHDFGIPAGEDTNPGPIMGIVRYTNVPGGFSGGGSASAEGKSGLDLNPFSGLGEWVVKQSTKVGLVIFGAIFVLVGGYVAFNANPVGKISKLAKAAK